jgi:hypothetical protein
MDLASPGSDSPSVQHQSGRALRLVALLEKRLGSHSTLYEILQILSVSLFETSPVNQLFQALSSKNEISSHSKQLCLFD